LPVLWFLGLLLALLLLRESTLLSDLDIGWLLRSGELIWQQGRLPETDVFSFTQTGKHWFLYQWGFEIYLWGLHQIGGLGGAIWGGAVLVALTYGLLLYFVLSLGLPRLLSLGLTILAATATSHYWYSRPGTATFLFYLIVLILLENYRRAPGRQLWWLPPLFLLWANVHIGFVMGLMAVSVYGLWSWLSPEDFRGMGATRDLRLLQVLPLCLLALLANPYGLHLLPYVTHSACTPYLNDSILEHQSPNFHSPILLFFLLQINLLLWLPVSRYPARRLFLTLLTITLGLALYSVRHLTFFSLTATLVLAYHLRYCWGYQAPEPMAPPGRGWAWGGVGAALSLLLVAGVNHWQPGHYSFITRNVPTGAAAFLKSQASATRPIKVFCQDDQWTSYLIYELYPGMRVFLDTRYDFYGEAFIKTAVKVRDQARYNPQVLNPWGVDFYLLKKGEFTSRPEAKPDWALAYEDGQALIYRHLPAGAMTVHVRQQ
jgi:hypothetical protein